MIVSMTDRMPERPSALVGSRVLLDKFMILSMEMYPQKPFPGTSSGSEATVSMEQRQILSCNKIASHSCGELESLRVFMSRFIALFEPGYRVTVTRPDCLEVNCISRFVCIAVG